VALVVLLLPRFPHEVSVGERSAAALAALGVTNVALVRSDETVGLVLEGWSFDPGRAPEAAAAVGAGAATTLTTVARIAVSTTTTEVLHSKEE